MWFKNLTLFRFSEPFQLTPEALEQRLEEAAFRPCGSMERWTYGWTSPLGRQGQQLVHSANGYLMLCAQKEEKLIPASVINEIVAEKVAEIESKESRKVRRKERDGIVEEVIIDLLPRAFSHRSRTFAYIDPNGGWLIVDSSSAKKADDLTAWLRKSIDTLPIAPPQTKQDPGHIMTEWLAGEGCPDDISIEDECELISSEEEGGIVRCRRQDLFSPEIQSHLEAGKTVSKLAISWNDRISATLDDQFGIKKVRFLDLVQEEAEDVDTDDAAARFDTEFAIMTLELSRFLTRVIELFGGEASNMDNS